MTPSQQKECLRLFKDLCWATERLQDPDIDWIRPPTEVDEEILTEIEYQQLLAKSFLKSVGQDVSWVPAKP